VWTRLLYDQYASYCLQIKHIKKLDHPKTGPGWNTALNRLVTLIYTLWPLASNSRRLLWKYCWSYHTHTNTHSLQLLFTYTSEKRCNNGNSSQKQKKYEHTHFITPTLKTKTRRDPIYHYLCVSVNQPKQKTYFEICVFISINILYISKLFNLETLLRQRRLIVPRLLGYTHLAFILDKYQPVWCFPTC